MADWRPTDGSLLPTQFLEDWTRHRCTRGNRKHALAGGPSVSYGLGDAREVRRPGNAARVRHWDVQRAHAARVGAGSVHEAGASRIRQWHSLLRDLRDLRRDAQ